MTIYAVLNLFHISRSTFNKHWVYSSSARRLLHVLIIVASSIGKVGQVWAWCMWWMSCRCRSPKWSFATVFHHCVFDVTAHQESVCALTIPQETFQPAVWDLRFCSDSIQTTFCYWLDLINANRLTKNTPVVYTFQGPANGWKGS